MIGHAHAAERRGTIAWSGCYDRHDEARSHRDGRHSRGCGRTGNDRPHARCVMFERYVNLTENIRVTVIATGFSLNKGGEAEAEPAVRAQEEEEPAQDAESDPLTIGNPMLVGNGGTSLDVPTYLRNGRDIPQEHQEEPARPAVGDLDIPTFLRRKMNAS